MMLSLFVRQRLTTFVAKQTGNDLETLSGFVEAGDVTPIIDRVYGLAEVPQAMRDLEAGVIAGKIGITP